MSLESQVAALTTSTTDLITIISTRLSTLYQVASDASTSANKAIDSAAAALLSEKSVAANKVDITALQLKTLDNANSAASSMSASQINANNAFITSIIFGS